MKNILIALISLLFFSCNHDIPIANIEFIKIEKNNKYENSFFIYFSSDVELIENLQKEHSGLTVKCFLIDDIINKNYFSDYKGYYLQSIWDESKLINKTSKKHFYKIKARFYSDIGNNKKVTERVKQTINKNDINCLSCVATSVAYMNVSNRYISNTMCLPKKEIKKVMK